MNKKLNEIISTIILGVIILFIFCPIVVGIIYVVKVMPYNNDWTCIIAECRKVK